MVEYRSLPRMVFLMVVTLGLYGVFWYFWMSKEMLAYNRRSGNPSLWVIALGLAITFPPFYLIPVWKFADQVHLTSKGRYNRFLLFGAGLFIFFLPLIMLLAQKLLNTIALEQRAGMTTGEPAEAQFYEEAAEAAQTGDEDPGDESPDEERPTGPGYAEPPEESPPEESPGDDPYVESEDIRTIGR